MTITVESGRQWDAPTYRRQCPECGTIFTYNYSDTSDSGWKGGYQIVKCPTCDYPVAHLIAGGGEDINHPQAEDLQDSTPGIQD